MTSNLLLKPQTDEDRLMELEGEEHTRAYLKTLEALITSKTLEEACKGKGCMPHGTFHRVKTRSRVAWELYARARKGRADYRFDNLLERVEAEPDPQKARVILDAEKWTISKMNRGLYGDDPVTIQGPGGGPVQVEDGTAAALLEDIRGRLARKRKALALEAEGAAPGQLGHKAADPN